MHFGSTSQLWLRMMDIWLGLHWISFAFYDHFIKRIEVIDFRLFRATELTFAIIFKVQFNAVQLFSPFDHYFKSSVQCDFGSTFQYGYV